MTQNEFWNLRWYWSLTSSIRTNQCQLYNCLWFRIKLNCSMTHKRTTKEAFVISIYYRDFYLPTCQHSVCINKVIRFCTRHRVPAWKENWHKCFNNSSLMKKWIIVHICAYEARLTQGVFQWFNKDHVTVYFMVSFESQCIYYILVFSVQKSRDS